MKSKTGGYMTEEILEGIAQAVCGEIEKALKDAFLAGYDACAVDENKMVLVEEAWLEYINGEE